MAHESSKRVSILIPEGLFRQLEKQAEQSSRSVSYYVRQVLKWHLSYLNQFPRT